MTPKASVMVITLLSALLLVHTQTMIKADPIPMFSKNQAKQGIHLWGGSSTSSTPEHAQIQTPPKPAATVDAQKDTPSLLDQRKLQMGLGSKHIDALEKANIHGYDPDTVASTLFEFFSPNARKGIPDDGDGWMHDVGSLEVATVRGTKYFYVNTMLKSVQDMEAVVKTLDQHITQAHLEEQGWKGKSVGFYKFEGAIPKGSQEFVSGMKQLIGHHPPLTSATIVWENESMGIVLYYTLDLVKPV